MLGALLSGLARRSFLSLTPVFVVAGFVLGQGGLGVLDLDPTSDFVQGLAVVALVLILFRDGLEVEAEMLQKAWHLPFRKLVLAMPLTALLVALADSRAHRPRLDRVAAGRARCCRPTDPVLSSTVVTNPRVPRIIRHSLNLESGLNDGLALPAVLAFTAAAESRDDFVWWQFVLQDVGVGRAHRRARGRVAGRPADAARRRSPTRSRSTRSAWRSPPTGRPCCRPRATASSRCSWARSRSAIWRPDIRECFELRSEDMLEVVKLGVFLVFGAIFTLRHAVRATAGPRWRSSPSRCWSRGRSRCSSRSPAHDRSTPPRRRSWRGSGRRAWRR